MTALPNLSLGTQNGDKGLFLKCSFEFARVLFLRLGPRQHMPLALATARIRDFAISQVYYFV